MSCSEHCGHPILQHSVSGYSSLPSPLLFSPQLDNTRKLMKMTVDVWSRSPDMMTYSGGSRSRRNGIFAGTSDIQGMDMWVGVD